MYCVCCLNDGTCCATCLLQGLEVECRASGGLTQKDVDRLSKEHQETQQQQQQQGAQTQPQNKSSKQRAADALHVLRGLQLLAKSPGELLASCKPDQ